MQLILLVNYLYRFTVGDSDFARHHNNTTIGHGDNPDCLYYIQGKLIYSVAANTPYSYIVGHFETKIFYESLWIGRGTY